MSRTKRLSTMWTKHIQRNEGESNEEYKKRKSDFEGYVRNSKEILEVITTIIEEKLKTLDPSDEDYDKASWGYYQADRLGQTRAYNYVKGIIDL